MKSNLNFARQMQLLKRDLTIYSKSLIIFMGAVLLISMIIIYFLPSGLSLSLSYYPTHSINVPVLIGLFSILIGFSFTDMDSSSKKTGYLLIPAAVFEKYINRLLSTLLGFLILALIIYIIDSLFVKMLNVSNPYNKGNAFDLFNFDRQAFQYLKFYLLMHAVFFYGAVAFNRNSFLKTAVVCLALVVIVIGLLKLLTWIFIPNVDVSIALRLDTSVFYYSEEAYKKFEAYRNMLGGIFGFIAFYITPPFLWVLGYFRLKEEEAANGIQ